MSGRTTIWAMSQGIAALLIVAAALLLGTRHGMPQGDLRALVFTILVLMNVGLILVNRSFRSSFREAILRRNAALLVLVASVIGVLAIAIYWRPVRALFQFGLLHMDDLVVCTLAGALLIAILEVGKSVAHGTHWATA